MQGEEKKKTKSNRYLVTIFAANSLEVLLGGLLQHGEQGVHDGLQLLHLVPAVVLQGLLPTLDSIFVNICKGG